MTQGELHLQLIVAYHKASHVYSWTFIWIVFKPGDVGIHQMKSATLCALDAPSQVGFSSHLLCQSSVSITVFLRICAGHVCLSPAWIYLDEVPQLFSKFISIAAFGIIHHLNLTLRSFDFSSCRAAPKHLQGSRCQNRVGAASSTTRRCEWKSWYPLVHWVA